jgi:hypothetical protein
MLTVVPGAFFPAPADATAPTLQVSEPPISFQVPGGPKLSPTAAKSDAAATKMSLALFSTLSLTSLLLCELLWKEVKPTDSSAHSERQAN